MVAFGEEHAEIVRETVEGPVTDRLPASFLSEHGNRPDVLLYRGAWQEWAPHVIDIAVPLSPHDVKVT